MTTNFSKFGTLLTRDEAKKIRGGAGTCGAKSPSGDVLCGVSKGDALFWAGSGGNWCCDSCGTSTYCSEVVAI